MARLLGSLKREQFDPVFPLLIICVAGRNARLCQLTGGSPGERWPLKMPEQHVPHWRKTQSETKPTAVVFQREFPWDQGGP